MSLFQNSKFLFNYFKILLTIKNFMIKWELSIGKYEDLLKEKIVLDIIN